VVIEQQSGQQYSAQTWYALHADHNEIHFDDLALHFDTTSWLATRPGTVKWGGRGVEVETLELRSGSTGRIYVDGLLPTEGIADFRIAVDNFEIANLINLVQSDIAASGLVSLEVNLAGTARAPVFEGAAGVIGGSYAGRTLPELHATFSYADRRLVANAVANRTGLPPIVVAEGTMPVNLALSGVGENESRIPDGTLSVDITMDSLPLDVLPPIEGAISNMAGTAAGTVTIRGTVDAPVVTGAIALSDASVRLDPVGVTLRRIAGAIRMDGETIFIDSIAGRSGGPVRVTGTLGLETLTEPSFDLALHADNARVLDNHLGEIVADAELKMTGPFRDVLIDGSATIDHGVLYVPESSSKKLIDLRDPTLVKIIDTSTVTLDEIAPPPSPLLENLRIDVALTVERDTWVRSPEANVEVYGDLEISMDQANEALIIEGLLSTDRGEYTVFSKRFELTRGSATFIGTPDPDPTLQLTGEFQVPRPGQEALTIRVLIGGTLGEPRISLESDAQPPIPESDLLSYVAFGRTSTSLLHETGGVGPAASLAGFSQLAARQLASSLLGVLVNEFEGDAARGLGADYINITPSGNPVDASVDRFDEFLSNTEIEVGKYTDPSTFVVLQARPRLVFPGVIVQHRVTPELRIEAGFGPRFLLPQPTLGEQSLDPFNALGLFLIREWRFSSPAPEAPTVAPPPTVDEDLEKARREASEGNPP
ncbi:MAG: translocation/assembly module TamB domain-containing protein, partial [Gemmatimonadaceae bacterium]